MWTYTGQSGQQRECHSHVRNLLSLVAAALRSRDRQVWLIPGSAVYNGVNHERALIGCMCFLTTGSSRIRRA